MSRTMNTAIGVLGRLHTSNHNIILECRPCSKSFPENMGKQSDVVEQARDLLSFPFFISKVMLKSSNASNDNRYRKHDNRPHKHFKPDYLVTKAKDQKDGM